MKRRLIEERVALLETLNHNTYTRIEGQRIFARRSLLFNIRRVWRLWHRFSATRWV